MIQFNDLLMQEYEDKCYELDEAIETLRRDKDNLIDFRQHHKRIEYEEQCAWIKVQINNVHIKFINLCTDNLNSIYYKHEFDLVTNSVFEQITIESKVMLQQLVRRYENDINPLKMFELLYKSIQSYQDKLTIINANKYITLNSKTYKVELHPEYMTKYLLELYGFNTEYLRQILYEQN